MSSKVPDEQVLLAADGTPQLPHIAYDDDGYPHTDGAPLALNPWQREQFFYAYPGLQCLVLERFPNSFAASDLFIYPRKGDVDAGITPDVFIAFGAGNHSRNSYKLWEGEPVPAFILEFLSSTAADDELRPKRDVYEMMGVRELWLFDPFGTDIPHQIAGYRLRGGRYQPVAPLAGTQVFRCDVLGLEFRAEDGNLRIHDPVTGWDIKGYHEMSASQAGPEAWLNYQARRVKKLRRWRDERARQVAKREGWLVAEQRATIAEAEVARLRGLLRQRDSVRLPATVHG